MDLLQKLFMQEQVQKLQLEQEMFLYIKLPHMYLIIQNMQNVFLVYKILVLFILDLLTLLYQFGRKVASIEKSRAAVACSSGHAAQQLAFIPLLNNGDHFISSNKLYGGSINQFSKTFKSFGWNCDFVEPDELSNFENNIRDNTKFIFIETLSNPDGSIVDIEKVSKIAKKNHIPLNCR